MKKLILTSAIAIILSLPTVLSAQNPPHPNNGNAPTGGTNTPVGGAATLMGSGTVILALLATAYGSKKVYDLHKKEKG